MQNKDQYILLKNYFIKLGYSESGLLEEYEISGVSSSQKVDWVVMHEGLPIAVVEVKSSYKMDDVKHEDLKYDPSMRQAQRYARQLHAPYFIMTNGHIFLWFTTGSDGRPTGIQPVSAGSTQRGGHEDWNEPDFVRALALCRELLARECGADGERQLLLLLLAKYFDDPGELNKTKSVYQLSERILFDHMPNNGVNYRFICDGETLHKCYELLMPFFLPNMPRKAIIAALYEVFGNAQRGLHRVPAWLADEMIGLAEEKYPIMDLWADAGNIQPHIHQPAQFAAICTLADTWLWAVLMQLVIGGNVHDVLYMPISVLSNEKRVAEALQHKTNTVVMVLPFSSKLSEPIHLDEWYGQTNHLEDYLLYLAMKILPEGGRLVALTGESLLFAGGTRERFRKYLAKEYNIRAIISIPAGTLLSSGVKSSVLVIDKSRPDNRDSIYMAMAGEKMPSTDEEIVAVRRVFSSFREYACGDWTASKTNKAILVEHTELQDNLSVHSYILPEPASHKAPAPTMPLTQLCTQIIKGRAIRLGQNGTLPVLGPAAIRPYVVDKGDYNMAQAIPENAVYAEKNDIVLNNIGTHLGDSAVLLEEEPVPVSQHVYILKPDVSQILPQYLAIALNSDFVKGYFKQSAGGTMLPSLRLASLRETPVPVPSLPQQQVLVDTAQNISEHIAQMQQRLNRQQHKLDRLIHTLGTEEGE